MISEIQGILESSSTDTGILNVRFGILGSSITFEILSPKITAEKLKKYVGKEVIIFTHLNLTEGSIELYGFYTSSELTLFKNLIRVKNVGLKMAIRILSQMDAIDFWLAIQNNNIKAIKGINGIGPKMAEKLIRSLKVT